MSDYDSDENSDEEQPKFARWQPNYILIALDTSESMFRPNHTGRSTFMDAIEAISSIEDQLLFPFRSSTKCPIGIIAANDEDSNPTIAELEGPVLETVKKARELKKLPNHELKSKFGRKNQFDLFTFILLCKKKFMKISGKAHKKIILYITNDDDPIKSDPVKKQNVIREIETLAAVELCFHVLTMNEDFNCDLLYSSLETVDPDNVKVFCTPDLPLLSDKLATYLQPPFNQQKSAFYPFKAEPDRYFDIIVKKPVKIATFTPNIHVTKDEHKRVAKPQPVFKEESSYHFCYSAVEAPIAFTKAEKTELFKTDFQFGYTLLAVCDKLSEHGFITEGCSLIEKPYNDQSELFDTFWQYCYEKKKVLLCARKYKIGQRVRTVELFPLLINNNKIPTFCVTRLPNLDEMYYLPRPKCNVNVGTSTARLQAIDKLVDRLMFDFDPSNFPKASYRKKKQYVKSQLLNETVDRAVGFEISKERMDEVAREVIQEFMIAFNMEAPGAKRKGAQTQSKSKKK